MSTLSRHLPVQRYCMKAFSPVSGAQVVDFFVSGGGHRGCLLFLIVQWWNRCACSTLPFYSVLKSTEQKTANTPTSSSFRVELSLTAMPLGAGMFLLNIARAGGIPATANIARHADRLKSLMVVSKGGCSGEA